MPDPHIPENLINAVFYIAHLDTDFKMDWQLKLNFDLFNGRREPFQIKQLRDGNFIVLGDQEHSSYLLNVVGWAMKVTRTGDMLWQHTYFSDSNQFAYIRDMVERPDGSLIFVGKTYNDTLPAWHNSGDLWIIGTDSNGCELPGCTPGLWPEGVNNVAVREGDNLTIYPNPTYGSITIKTSMDGIFILQSMDGKQISQYPLAAGNNSIELPRTLAEGIYMGTFKPTDGSKPIITRLVYQP